MNNPLSSSDDVVGDLRIVMVFIFTNDYGLYARLSDVLLTALSDLYLIFTIHQRLPYTVTDMEYEKNIQLINLILNKWITY